MRKRQSGDKSPHVGSRGRDYLRPDEAKALIKAAGKLGRRSLRLIYRHGLRASEARDVIPPPVITTHEGDSRIG